MSVTEQELNISNKSYINKDFESVYRELFEYATLLSNRFSPSDANESDPFIIMMKLLAFVTDKVNYNCDKNILERFILSCTQEKSMRDITERLGYRMKYYRSAKTEVIFKYKSNIENDISIPKFSIVSNGDTIQYVTVNDAIIDHNTRSSTAVDVIQGKLKDLTVLGNSVIQLENLNSKNIIYFPERMVAENGVFISGGEFVDGSYWEASDNLNTEQYGTAVYKFGYDSKEKLPYIEFPQWISDIIGNGLNIKYIVTDGLYGNVKAKELISVTRNSNSDNINDSDIIVINSTASISGANPETLDEAYQGAKKIIGTFDTLVTCRDYANKIYNMLDDYDDNIVSNIQVGDRRNDINYSCDIVTLSDDCNTITKSFPLSDITPYDIILYATNPIKDFTYSGIKTKTGYLTSFEKLPYTDNQNLYPNIETRLEDYKTISHNFKRLHDNDIFIIRNKHKLDAVINTNSKVNILEQSEILTNITNSLIRKYNAHNVNFGYDIPFDDLLNTMENSDSRIKSISLQEPEQTPVLYTADGSKIDVVTSDGKTSDKFKYIIAKNILAGRVPLFDYDNSFSYSYKYDEVVRYDDISMITTKANINQINKDSEYKLLDNECIQFLAPNFISDARYSYGINYCLKLNNGNYIAKDSLYLLSENDTLYITYKNSDDQDITVKYKSNDYIKANFDLYTSDYKKNIRKETPTKTVIETVDGDSVSYDCYTLRTNEQIDHVNANIESVETTRKCYWLTNKPKNEISWIDVTDSGSSPYVYEYILEENEYFFMTDDNLQSLYSYGSGTRLEITSKLQQTSWINENYVDIEKIEENGIEALRDVLVDKNFSSEFKLVISENEIITIVAGDKIKSNKTISIPNNKFELIDDTANVEYKLASDTSYIKLPDRSKVPPTHRWRVRSILDINAGPNMEQKLAKNQEIILIKANSGSETGNTIILRSGKSLQFNIPIQLSGGENIDLSYLDLDLKTKYPKIITYTDDENVPVTQSSDNFFSLKIDKTSGAYVYVYPIAETTSNDRYMMIQTSLLSGKLIITANGGSLSTLSGDGVISESGKILTITKSENSGFIIVKISDKCTKLIFKATDLSETPKNIDTTVILSSLKQSTGYNKYLGLQKNDDLIDYMKKTFKDKFSKFYALGDVDSTKHIELSSRYNLLSAQAFYDSNNIANKWVIPEIDFENSEITIARSSKK